MNETDTLGRFTPDAGRLDRDEVLFQAGRASAASVVKSWKRVAIGLALSQLATLGVLATVVDGPDRPAPFVAPPAPPVVEPEPRSAPAVDPEPSRPPDPNTYAALARAWADGTPAVASPANVPDRSSPPRPVLTAGGWSHALQ